MKSIIRQSGKRAAFTIIELLTVMSIIIILIGLLVPSLNMARRYAKKLTQMNQLRTIGIAIEFFNSEFDGYPPSGAMDGASHCAINGADGISRNEAYNRKKPRACASELSNSG